MSDEEKAGTPNEPQWERAGNATYRLLVPGGWLYRYFFKDSVAMVFVPEPAPGPAKPEVLNFRDPTRRGA